jgi:hypothetical protein
MGKELISPLPRNCLEAIVSVCLSCGGRSGSGMITWRSTLRAGAFINSRWKSSGCWSIAYAPCCWRQPDSLLLPGFLPRVIDDLLSLLNRQDMAYRSTRIAGMASQSRSRSSMSTVSGSAGLQRSGPSSPVNCSGVRLVLRKSVASRTAELRSASLRSAELRSAKLRSAELRNAELRSAELRSADLRSADLRSAELRSADLRTVELRSAESEDCGAEVCGAEVCEAEVCGAEDCVAEVCGAEVCGAEVCGAEVCVAEVCGSEDCVAEDCVS